MLVKSISLYNYRNYRDLQVDFHPFLNLITGENAQGKTNILEAIFYGATGKSHRTNYDSELINWGHDKFNINLLAERNYGRIKIEILVRSDGKKIIKINNQVKKKTSELLGTLNAVLFSPEDMMLVKGGPSIRRRFLDIEISQTSPFYCHSLASYNRALSQRNNLLKVIREKKEDTGMLEIWDCQIAEYGTNIIKKRTEVMEKLIPLAAENHAKITEGKEQLNLSYLPSVDILKDEKVITPEEGFLSILKENRNNDINKGITMIGPHRDDIGIRIGNINVKTFGSQGQQRTCALSMKLSELEFMKKETGEYPILLLDDVMSELDSGRRKFLLEVVNGKIQTFVTSTGIEEVFEPARERRVFKVKSGKISLVQEG